MATRRITLCNATTIAIPLRSGIYTPTLEHVRVTFEFSQPGDTKL